MTTPDPATLREALGDWTTDSPPPWQVKATVINAARWALDLIEGGKEVSYCLTHDTISGCPFDPRVPCKRVKRLLVAL